MRAACREVAATATQVRIVDDALDVVTVHDVPAFDPEIHYVEGSPDAVAAYVLVLDAVNFGSGWFPELPGFGYEHVARALSERWRADGPIDPPELRAMTAGELATVLGGVPADHELAALYARACRELGSWLGDRTALEVVRAAEPSAQALAAQLAMLPLWADTGFLKRAQIAAADLVLAGVARFDDVDRLTAFADNVLPQVLRHEGVLELAPALARRIDAGELLLPGSAEERELRACAVEACERLATRLGMAPRELDNVLWTRGTAAADRMAPAHRTRTTFY